MKRNQQQHSLVPHPAKLKLLDGRFKLPTSLFVTVDPIFIPVYTTARLQFHKAGLNLEQSTQQPQLILHQDPSLVHEAYTMSITPDLINLYAGNPPGMFHGLQTLRQLVLSCSSSSQMEIPCMDIHDRPEFTWRGCMLDCSRHFHTVPFIKKLLDAMSLHHLNIFHWHLTDDQGWRLPIPGYPELTEIGAWRIDSRQTWQGKIGGYYERQEIDEIVQYALERQITVVPEVDLPGHTSALLAALPRFGCTGGPYKVEDRFGIFDDVLCAGNPELDSFLDALFDTLAECFPGPYVHIGGDEVPTTRWESCPRCATAVANLKLPAPTALQSAFTQRLSQHLSKRGKTAVGWDEILDGNDAGGISKDTIVMSWRGKEVGTRAAQQGLRFVMSPQDGGSYLNFKHLPDPDEPGHLDVTTIEQCIHAQVIPEGLPKALHPLILGGQANLWCELIHNGRIAEYMLFPRLCLLAEAFWTPDHTRSKNPIRERLEGLGNRLDRLGICRYRETFIP